jgi:hypothetical protein
MKLHFHVSKTYFFTFLLLLVTEILIALYLHDEIIRPYIGDVLVVILIYCFIKSFFSTPVIPTAIAVLVFAYTIEMLQYFRIVEVLGLQRSRLARVVIGTSFEWIDLIAYTAGALLIVLVEKLRKNR